MGSVWHNLVFALVFQVHLSSPLACRVGTFLQGCQSLAQGLKAVPVSAAATTDRGAGALGKALAGEILTPTSQGQYLGVSE